MQVCIGENEVILNMTSEISIMITSNVLIIREQGPEERSEDARHAGASMLAILGNTIVQVQGTRDGTLRIKWDSGAELHIFDTWKEFESYTIRNGVSLLVV